MIDPLSDFLARLQSESVFPVQMEARGRWGLRYPAFRHMKFGGIIKGERWFWAEGVEPQCLRAGDFYLLTDGRPYCMASDPDAPLAEATAAFASYRPSDGNLIYGEGKTSSVAVAGRFTFADDDMAAMLRVLPPLIHVPAQDVAATPLPLLMTLIKAETGAMNQGGRVAASSLANLVLVHILRAWLAMGKRSASWLAATSDRQIGAALSVMHERVGHDWSLDLLARHVGMSRSLFAKRFAEAVGVPPMTYLLGWRMTIARTALRNGERNITALAERLGYGSPTAFRIAFRREVGESPGRYRIGHNAN
ncbi:AraC family transcriptional regulator [Labrys monachus]|uniref:AraC-like DNA-binding protein n=1 Tax=Labrys monachus TaxID=217067 RepID=A0ABU0FLX0_9HYPH|nr:AraC family transcriptional regulator [Labrys monachus]MDQ0395600.1 AraC-like DNA-binding protein [Labrys monachus]